MRLHSLIALALLLGACKSEPPAPVTIENTREISATVAAIDVDTRMVVLQGPDGEAFPVQVSPEVRNLAQVNVGDRVVARYHEALAVELRSRGDGEGTIEAPTLDVAAGRAEVGDQPGALLGAQVSQTVRITNVDKENHVVSFYGSDGLGRSLPVRTPEGRAFADRLEVGDEVNITYTEALAISVEPAQ